jgi:hypothetical protein
MDAGAEEGDDDVLFGDVPAPLTDIDGAEAEAPEWWLSAKAGTVAAEAAMAAAPADEWC